MHTFIIHTQQDGWFPTVFYCKEMDPGTNGLNTGKIVKYVFISIDYLIIKPPKKSHYNYITQHYIAMQLLLLI